MHELSTILAEYSCVLRYTINGTAAVEMLCESFERIGKHLNSSHAFGARASAWPTEVENTQLLEFAEVRRGFREVQIITGHALDPPVTGQSDITRLATLQLDAIQPCLARALSIKVALKLAGVCLLLHLGLPPSLTPKRPLCPRLHW